MKTPKPPSYKVVIELSEEKFALLSQAQQISGLSPQSLAQVGLMAICRHVERKVVKNLSLPLEIISTKELEGYKETSIVPLRVNAPSTIGAAGCLTRQINPVTIVLLG